MIIKVSVIIFILFCGISSYFLLLQPTITHYEAEKKVVSKQRHLLKEKSALAKLDALNISALSHWKHQHPRLFRVAQSSPTVNQLLQQVMQLAQQSGFSIIEAAPLINTKKQTTPFFHLTLSGGYLALFYFIEKINSDPFPIALTQLKILHAGQFDFKLSY